MGFPQGDQRKPLRRGDVQGESYRMRKSVPCEELREEASQQVRKLLGGRRLAACIRPAAKSRVAVTPVVSEASAG